jgi:hypothetical protein
MDKNQYEEGKKVGDAISKVLEDGNLSAEDREKFETLRSQVAGYLLSPWLPVGVGRKAIMLALIIIGGYGLMIDKPLIALTWLMAPLFSPRLVGETLRFIGSLKK